MDYDGAMMVLEQVKEYRLPAEDDEKIAKLTQALKLFDWDSMEDLLS